MVHTSLTETTTGLFRSQLTTLDVGLGLEGKDLKGLLRQLHLRPGSGSLTASLLSSQD